MKNYQYLIIGGGMTAAAAVDGIREVDPTGNIGVISMEADPPYNRPPLSKGLWKGDPVAGIWRKPKGDAPEFHLNHEIKEIIPKERRAIDSRENAFTYEKLLLATGGTPRRLPFDDHQIIYFRTLADYRRLRALTEKGDRFAVIGAGFIGSEIAAALAMNGKEVTMIFPGHEIGGRMFPRELAHYVSGVYRKKGVELLGREKVVALEARDNQRALKTSSANTILVDAVVAGIGIEPNIALAQAAGLSTENGIVVNELLHTSDANIYAAGDVAEFYNPTLQKRMRVEHEDNANTMGRLAGRNMAGMAEPYNHLPFFYSDLFELGYEAVGEVDSQLETFADWTRPNEEGVVYYLKDARVRGVLLWNVWGQVAAARQLIAEPGPFTGEKLKGRLPAKNPSEAQDG
jgi:3-phenylpropionate/trans-cinnamate dioxygenase ferredoxin reductase component